MANVVRILGLDDDNHAPMFRAETGEIYNSPRELIEFLSRAHDVEYDVRMFAIVDEWSGGLEELDECAVDLLFSSLEGLGDFDGNNPDDVFDLFWASANRRWW